MISTVIFDLGNVLVKVKHKGLLQHLKNELDNRISLDELKALFMSSPACKSYQIGSINSDQFYEQIKRELKLQLSKDIFKKCWQDILGLIDQNVSLLPILKRNYKLAIISDTNPWHIDIIGEKFEIFNYFQVLIFSYDVHLTKPDPRIFRLAMQRTDSEPENCVYIDDLEQNIEAAKKLNMHGILYKTHSELVHELQNLEIKL